jgi:hypothetical protein
MELLAARHRGSVTDESHSSPAPGLNKLSYSQVHGIVQILSVDDEDVNQIVVEEILTSSGYVYAK